MAETLADLEVLVPAEEVKRRVEDLASRLAPRLGPEPVGICLLLGGMWFAADLSRSLSRLGKALAFDALWLSSYADGQTSSGRCEVLAGPRRDLAGRQVLIMDDVLDTGVSLAAAVELARAAGAAEVMTAVFARKPWPGSRSIEPDVFAWEAPARFLLGYGMDLGGRFRDLPFVAATR